MASAVYIINDLKDIEIDRLHKSKRFRPLAAGKLSRLEAVGFLLILLFSSLLITYIISNAIENLTIIYLVLAYLVQNILYSQVFKNYAIFDVFIIATGFVLRLFVGSIATDIFLSQWIIIMTFLLALFLAFAKRRDDVLILKQSGKIMRKSIQGYNLEFINASMVIMAGVVIVFYTLYTVSPNVTDNFNTENLYLTLIFVIFGILRYLQLAFVYNDTASPTKLLIKDKILQLAILGWISTFILIIYI